MKIDEFYKKMRKIYFRHLLWPVIPIVASLVFMYFIPFKQILNPIQVNSTAEAIKAVEAGYEYLELTATKIIYSGYDYMRDDEIHGQYYYDLVDGKECVFFLFEPEEDNNSVYLDNVYKFVKVEETNGIFDNMLNMFSGTINWTPEGVEEITKDYILSEVDYHYQGYTILVFIIMTIFIYGVIVFMYNLAIALVPQLCPKILVAKYMFKGKKRMGVNGFVQMICNEINNAKVAHGNMYITEHFIVNLDKLDFDLVPIDKIVLAYEHGTLRSIMGIHLKVSYTIHLNAKRIFKYHIARKTLEEANSVLDYLRENKPDILIGYTVENKLQLKDGLKNDDGLY